MELFIVQFSQSLCIVLPTCAAISLVNVLATETKPPLLKLQNERHVRKQGSILFFLHIRTVQHLDIIKVSIYSPADALMSCLKKTILKFILKFV